MLLRSSSTSATGALLSSFSDSPSRDFDITNYTNSSPVSEFNHETEGSRPQGFRRAWSDGSLERLVCTSCDKEDFHNSTAPNKSPHRDHRKMLHTAPSFSIFNTIDDQGNNEEDVRLEEEALVRTVTIGEGIEGVGGGGFSFGNEGMGLIEEGEEEREEGVNGIGNQNIEEVNEPISPPLYLAAGLGIDGIDFGGRGGGGVHLTLPNFDDSDNAEEYYKRMINEYPCHPLFLSNYAQLLQSNGDLHGAAEYYHRAALADPEDGEVLLKNALLVWELHRDQDRALSFFQRAVQAAPQDSYVLAAYASFLWEIEDVEEDTLQQQIQDGGEGSLNKPENSSTRDHFKPVQLTAGLTRDHSASDPNKGGNVEENLRRMVEENPCNSLVLRNYAQFLCQTKGDLKGADEYYSRAVLADPGDGEILSQYAQLVWKFHGDHDKALRYFERAVQATPNDSYVLAAYASFLWETEENDYSTSPDQIQQSHYHGGAVSAATV